MSREEILEVLDHPMTAKEIAAATGGNVGTIRHLLITMRKRGYVTAITGQKQYIYQRADARRHNQKGWLEQSI